MLIHETKRRDLQLRICHRDLKERQACPVWGKLEWLQAWDQQCSRFSRRKRVRKGLKQGRHSCMRGMHSHLQLGREVDIYLHTKKESKTFLCRNCQIVIEDKPW